MKENRCLERIARVNLFYADGSGPFGNYMYVRPHLTNAEFAERLLSVQLSEGGPCYVPPGGRLEIYRGD